MQQVLRVGDPVEYVPGVAPAVIRALIALEPVHVIHVLEVHSDEGDMTYRTDRKGDFINESVLGTDCRVYALITNGHGAQNYTRHYGLGKGNIFRRVPLSFLTSAILNDGLDNWV